MMAVAQQVLVEDLEEEVVFSQELVELERLDKGIVVEHHLLDQVVEVELVVLELVELLVKMVGTVELELLVQSLDHL